MDMEKLLKDAEDLLTPLGVPLSRPAGYRMDAEVTVDTLVPAAKALTEGKWGYLSAITGMDKPAPAPAKVKNRVRITWKSFTSSVKDRL